MSIASSSNAQLLSLSGQSYFKQLGTNPTSFGLTCPLLIGMMFDSNSEIEGSRKPGGRQNQRIRLQYIDSGGYLHGHDKKYIQIGESQQEVSSRS
ncbi:hypothetical protein T459_17514 [Capsicum annuum]|uniref:Uncharacterized protein n=1 Tax=Capsicum annuum TaxID=4072 RepID=A0A2G2ZBU9_CAPAN|nr:hypothetical protein T459_17514 [Capsicum annuum]